MSIALNFRKGVDITCHLTGDRAIKNLHRKFLNKNCATDCMTFADRKNIEIVISLDQAQKQAIPRGLDLSEEVSLLLCHGLLHAKGFDDIALKDRLEMRRKEFECLAKIL